MNRKTLSLAATFIAAVTTSALASEAPGLWLSSDFHQHTYYTDGSTTFDFVMGKNIEFGLDWWANSEHGGSRNRDGNGIYWDTYVPNPILGDYATSGGHQVMWRWQSLRDFVYPGILEWRALVPEKRILSGLEWNVPGHEHCSVGVVASDAAAISAFEFQFDKSDTDTSRVGEVTPYGVLAKVNGRNYPGGNKPSGVDRHLDAVAACAWMQAQYNAGLLEQAYIIFAHIERAGAFRTGSSDGGYNVEHFRDFNNVAPDICFGFEGAPGHQVNEARGFGNLSFGGTFGGAGFYTAQVGGLWDALLGEGRRWFNFASSDYHRHWTAGGDDFYPGEYQKDWIYTQDLDGDGDISLVEIVKAMCSGNSFHVMGDLISELNFSISQNNSSVPMGGELVCDSKNPSPLKITIKFKSPSLNFHGDVPKVDHIDLIAGEITSAPMLPGDPNYTVNVNPTARVIATFSGKNLSVDKEGYHTILYHLPKPGKNMYFRLRGTNLAPGTLNETDEFGNPLPDSEVANNATQTPEEAAEEAWADLWFYGNPIFVSVE